MATVSTIDPKTAVIQVLIMPDFVDEIIGLFESLKRTFDLEEIPAGHIICKSS